MGGRPKRKVFCEATTRKSIREGKPRNCMANGYLCANGRYLFRFHGSQNIQGFKRPNYMLEQVPYPVDKVTYSSCPLYLFTLMFK